MVKGSPSGTVTFLFTDIEGSTRILRDLGERYSDLLSLHHRLLRDVWVRHRGVEVLTEGDAFFVAFANAADAVAAAVDGQRALAGADWPTVDPIKVRMGMHTGYARPVDDDYRALAVHQAARVVDAANGGQILATGEVIALLGDAEIEVTDLGRYRVRDFDEPITLYRLSASDLGGDDRAPRVRPADSHNLVRPATSMVNRVSELAELAELLRPGGVVTLLGPGGAGKTRLSVEVGLNVAERWPDGVWFVDLSPLSEGEVVPMAIAEAVSAPSVRGNDAQSDVVAHLAERSMVLVLDNCEHLIEPIARVVHDLLTRCPNLAVLATSRVPLGLIGESLYRLEPLGAIDAESDAVRLYVERSGRGVDADLGDIVDLCRAIDGLPLAIELAATRSHLLTPAEMTARMRRWERRRRRDPRPDGPRSSAEPRPSARLESRPARSRRASPCSTRLAVLADGFDVSLAEAVAGDEPVPVARIPELVWSLIDWSLVVREVAAGSSRYMLPSTVRSYVLEGADEHEVTAARIRLADALVERLGPDRTMSGRWVTEFGVDLENVRAVVAHPVTPDPTARSLAWSIGQYHDVTASYRSGISEVARCIDQRPSPGPDLVALLTLQADLHLRLGERADAEQLVERAAALVEQVGVPVFDDMGVVRTKGELALRSDDPEAALRLAQAALGGGQATPRGEARLWNLAAIAHNTLGDPRAAADALDQCVRAEEAAGLETFLANTHGNYAELLLTLGDPVGAATHQLAAFEWARSMVDSTLIAYSQMIAARLALDEGSPADAVRMQSAADVILAEQGLSLYALDAQQRQSMLDAAHEALGAADFERARLEGESTPADQLADQTDEILRRRAASPSTTGG